MRLSPKKSSKYVFKSQNKYSVKIMKSDAFPYINRENSTGKFPRKNNLLYYIQKSHLLLSSNDKLNPHVNSLQYLLFVWSSKC